jgi:Na+/proline symporter/signal transduction histidine kinase
MLQGWVILLVSFAYLGLLFGIAYYADMRADRGRSVISNPYIYTLSIAVFCTAWTFYGSVGRAASTGVGFLPVYLGPTLMAGLWWLVLRKIVRIAKEQRITSIADFIGSRYGKSTLLAGLVTIIAVVGIMPYISLQLKAVSTSYQVLQHYPELVMPSQAEEAPISTDKTLYIALLLAAFTIVFGTRHIDVTERHEGMVAAIAFESIVKLIAFLSVGAFVTFVLFEGPRDLFTRAAGVPELERLMSMESTPGGYAGWFSLVFLSMMAIMFLPRQFQVAVVENVNEDHLRKAAWLFPLYLLVINLFVLPIALGGALLFPGQVNSVDPDTYVLTLPMAERAESLALLVYIGGLSAATGMVIVATITLSTMVCNDLVMPALLRLKWLALVERQSLGGLLIAIRRWTIVAVLLLGYLYFRLIGESYALVTTGLVSFAAAAQFAPAILIGIYWRGASRAGAMAGLLAGFLVWAYTLLLPGFAISGWLPRSFLDNGPFGIEMLRPYELFGLTGLSSITHAVFWSMFANIACLVGVSLFTRQSMIEQVQAKLFTGALETHGPSMDAYQWGGTATVEELRALVARFLGETRTAQAFENYARERHLGLEQPLKPDPSLILFAERLLAGAIGAASARVMVSSTVRGEALGMEGVLKILDETSQVREYSHRLEEKSRQLEAATSELRAANDRLKELDHLKDEFVATVSHELRTPLTSIRAFSEILRDNPEMESQQRHEFLQIVVKETERLTRLINDVLDLAKIESGRMEWHLAPRDLRDLIRESTNSVSQLLTERGAKLEQDLPEQEAVAEVDGDRLMQVVINLLSNASRFCGSQDGRVGIRLGRNDLAWRVEVEDNGAGIPGDQLEYVFDKFHQVEAAETGKSQGTGLGLPISRGIIEFHGGRIWAENRSQGGARFVFEIPGRATTLGEEEYKVTQEAARPQSAGG